MGGDVEALHAGSRSFERRFWRFLKTRIPKTPTPSFFASGLQVPTMVPVIQAARLVLRAFADSIGFRVWSFGMESLRNRSTGPWSSKIEGVSLSMCPFHKDRLLIV